MNPPPKMRPDLPGGEIHVVIIWGLALGLLALWAWSHRLSAGFLKTRPWRGLGFLGRVLLGTGALTAFWGSVGRHLVLETAWPLALNAFIGALAVEIVLALYALEKRIVSPAAGRWLTGLRLLAVFFRPDYFGAAGVLTEGNPPGGPECGGGA